MSHDSISLNLLPHLSESRKGSCFQTTNQKMMILRSLGRYRLAVPSRKTELTGPFHFQNVIHLPACTPVQT